MSVYVDRLPDCCDCCVCNDDYWKCGINRESISHDGRREDCPLIEIVHCKDCDNNDANCGGSDNWCYKFGIDIDDDDFCSYGEKQVTGKLESVEKATSEGEESTIYTPTLEVSDDCISRQAAIEEIALHDPTNGTKPYFSGHEVIDILKCVPPVEPKRLPQPHKCVVYRDGSLCRHPIEACSECPKHEGMRALNSERPKGKWIDHTEDGYVECPFCHSATTCDGNKDELHFCFSCGADMRGDKE